MQIEFESDSIERANNDCYDLDLAKALSESIKNVILPPKDVHVIILKRMYEFIKKW